jgi:hypothetical protein
VRPHAAADHDRAVRGHVVAVVDPEPLHATRRRRAERLVAGARIVIGDAGTTEPSELAFHVSSEICPSVFWISWIPRAVQANACSSFALSSA